MWVQGFTLSKKDWISLHSIKINIWWVFYDRSEALVLVQPKDPSTKSALDSIVARTGADKTGCVLRYVKGGGPSLCDLSK